MRGRKITIWLIWMTWMIIFPVGIWNIYQKFPPITHFFSLEVFCFLLLMIVVSALPIVINNTPIFFLQGVSLAVFLLFGLFVEVVLSQVALVTLLLKLRIRKDESYRIPINSLMFFFVSIVSGLVYYAVGGSKDLAEITYSENIWPILAYVITYFVVNQVLLSFILIVIYRKGRNLFGRDLIWECISTIVVFPIGIALFVLFREIQVIAILFIGVPLISLAIIMQTYYSSLKINEYLHKASTIGHQLAERLSVDEVMDLFVTKISEIFPVDYTYIYDVKQESQLELLRFVQEDKTDSEISKECKAFEDIGYHVLHNKRSYLFHYRKDWEKIVNRIHPKNDVESIIALPIIRNSNIVGILLLASRSKRRYENFQKNILDILCSYFSIAVENAKHYEETKKKSEHCQLTGVYNHGYFKELLKKKFNRFKKGGLTKLSLLMVDVDYFKRINDTYGHECGDQVLCAITEIMQRVFSQKGVVARYGGEEFVILIPGSDEGEALELAEQLRAEIAGTPITVQNQLEFNGPVNIHVTASIGVAAASLEDEDYLTIVRNADRAMYIGAKKAGRNKVGVYEK